ncbi:hypothetical protein pEaSNUABM8_00227 [Erwinia phage pEa_SNUABM_8]|nr:hypothetical protein pEaSNUABM8_00227 [Erwinia phage pEa_SNUABM_8]QVW54979.1 hypothetical protein pEaSNUABM4_00226 [Erwinia phage pEa_SNUABM_4]
MWKKIKLLRQRDPIMTGLVDTNLFATFLYFVGVYIARQDPLGTFMVCYLGIGTFGGMIVGGSYCGYKSDWIDACPYTRDRLKMWKNAAEDITVGEAKQLTFEEANRFALKLKKQFEDIPFEYAFAAIYHGHRKYTSEQWLPKEAKTFRNENPKVWHIMDYV